MNQTTAFQQVSEFILSTFQDTLKEPSGELHYPYISPRRAVRHQSLGLGFILDPLCHLQNL